MLHESMLGSPAPGGSRVRFDATSPAPGGPRARFETNSRTQVRGVRGLFRGSPAPGGSPSGIVLRRRRPVGGFYNLGNRMEI